MKTLLRTLLYLALIAWLGSEIFFPVVAAVTFDALQLNTHLAGTIVKELLGILHNIGLVSGAAALAVLALAPACAIYKPRAVLVPMILIVLMLAGTAYSQYGIIPAMERDRIAAGGSIDIQDRSTPSVVDFNRLHNRSEGIEFLIVLLGIATVALIARSETTRI